ncbi:nucleoside hydrolase [Blastococcus sp. Marseille-P5729]|uniref:nucleoside hydrolase n=1 Tax=Blastococcus sp. Marseille-P5729 TaxID=2086582 RepID=UPI0018FEC1BA|nr:nucleoside hydrolase [Blastococcus sp. Marseille-P5729]
MRIADARVLHVDCDTGVDDAMALLYLLLDERAEIASISTVFGNTTAPAAAANCLRVLDLVDADAIPVAVGASRSLRGDIPELAPHVHGEDGLGGVGLPASERPLDSRSAAELIVHAARARPGELHILATGPLTNLALALGIEPDLPALVAGVTVMGGAADAPGNQTAAAEANILHDPEAAHAVLSADWPITLVPLDVTMREVVTERHRAALAASDQPAARFVAAITDFYFEFFHADSYTERSSPCHDALAAAIAVGDVLPMLAPVIRVEIDCTDGPSRGATICDTRGRYRGFPRQDDARCRVVLETAGTFPDRLVERLTRRRDATQT